MIVPIPKMYSRSELLTVLAPPSNDERIAQFRDKLRLTKEELEQKQIEGEAKRETLIALMDIRDFIKRKAA